MRICISGVEALLPETGIWSMKLMATYFTHHRMKIAWAGLQKLIRHSGVPSYDLVPSPWVNVDTVIQYRRRKSVSKLSSFRFRIGERILGGRIISTIFPAMK